MSLYKNENLFHNITLGHQVLSLVQISSKPLTVLINQNVAGNRTVLKICCK